MKNKESQGKCEETEKQRTREWEETEHSIKAKRGTHNTQRQTRWASLKKANITPKRRDGPPIRKCTINIKKPNDGQFFEFGQGHHHRPFEQSCPLGDALMGT